MPKKSKKRKSFTKPHLIWSLSFYICIIFDFLHIANLSLVSKPFSNALKKALAWKSATPNVRVNNLEHLTQVLRTIPLWRIHKLQIASLADFSWIKTLDSYTTNLCVYQIIVPNGDTKVKHGRTKLEHLQSQTNQVVSFVDCFCQVTHVSTTLDYNDHTCCCKNNAPIGYNNRHHRWRLEELSKSTKCLGLSLRRTGITKAIEYDLRHVKHFNLHNASIATKQLQSAVTLYADESSSIAFTPGIDSLPIQEYEGTLHYQKIFTLCRETLETLSAHTGTFEPTLFPFALSFPRLKTLHTTINLWLALPDLPKLKKLSFTKHCNKQSMEKIMRHTSIEEIKFPLPCALLNDLTLSNVKFLSLGSQPTNKDYEWWLCFPNLEHLELCCKKLPHLLESFINFFQKRSLTLQCPQVIPFLQFASLHKAEFKSVTFKSNKKMLYWNGTRLPTIEILVLQGFHNEGRCINPPKFCKVQEGSIDKDFLDSFPTKSLSLFNAVLKCEWKPRFVVPTGQTSSSEWRQRRK
jgi:hypothetical protein